MTESAHCFRRFFLSCVCLAAVATLPDRASALAYSADVEFDFNEGWIKITPPEYREGGGYGGTMKSSGLGLSFNWFTATTSVVDLSNDSYLFLTGDPDDLQFHLIQYLCAAGSPTPDGAFSSQWKMSVAKGRIQVSSHFISGRAVARAMAVADVCTDDYRQRNASFGFHALPNHQENFRQTREGRVLRIVWDAANWKDAVTRKAWQTIERVDEILKR